MMKSTLFSLVLGFLMLFSTRARSQECNIANRVQPDGSMLYYIQSIKFYWTREKSLYGGIFTDGSEFFLGLNPFPISPNVKNSKLADDLQLKLGNDSTYTLKHFDTQYKSEDTFLLLLFSIAKDQLKPLLDNEIIYAEINMGEETLRKYEFNLHKDSVSSQLDCFIATRKKNRTL